MKLRNLRNIVVLADTLNFSKAAQHVHLGQSAFSKSIASIEEHLGIRVFERSTNHVEVTPLGHAVVAHARQLLSEARNFDKAIEGLKAGELGSVSVGSGPYPARMFLEDVVRQFHAQHPKVSMSIRIDYWKHLLTLLMNNELDYFIADIRTMDTFERLQITPLGGITVGIFCDCRHPLVVDNPTRRIAPEELLPYTLACVSIPPLVLSELKEDIGLKPHDEFKINMQCDDLSFINSVVPGSDMLATTSNQLMAASLKSGDMVKLNIAMRKNRYGEWALVQIRDRSLTPAAASLAETLIENIRAGSLLDDKKFGLPGNKKLNFL